MTLQLGIFNQQLLNIPPAIYCFVTKPLIDLKQYGIFLGRWQRPRRTSAYILIFLLAIVPRFVFAEETPDKTPENATAKSYGGGWNCNTGFRESKGGCIAIKMPENAYPNNKSYGPGWECKHGFREAGGSCKHIDVPENGYLDYSGTTVKCNRGYLLTDNTCKAIKVPVNAYLDESSYGTGWTCERGYRAERGACVALKVPENAHIGFSGKVWECNRPYIRKQDHCVLPVLQ